MGSARVARSLEEARSWFAPSGVTIGNFDGVHLGHQELMRLLAAECARLRCKPSVLTFDPHPTKVLAPNKAPRLLSRLEDRLRWMGEAGIEQVLVAPFDLEFSHLSPEEFVRRVLVEAAGARVVLVGANFRFGRKAAGDATLLRSLGERFGFETKTVVGVAYRGRIVSSTEVRNLLEIGDTRMAARLLGRPYSLSGAVVPGHGVGAKKTVPTLNLATDAEVLPANGVYITTVRDPDSGRRWPAVSNIGFRPTFEGHDLSIESFLLEGYSEPAPTRIEVSFLFRLREERKFPDPESLKVQILRDATRAQRYFRRCRKWIAAAKLLY